MKQILVFSILWFCLLSCKDKEMPMPEPPVNNPTDTTCVECKNCKEGDGVTGPLCAWKSNILNPNGGSSGSDAPFIYKDMVIISSTQDDDDEDDIIFYNKYSGKRLGSWEDYVPNAPSSPGNKSFYAYGNTLMVGLGTRMYAIDLNTFKTKFVTKSHEWGGSVIGGIGSNTFNWTKSEDQRTIYLEKGSTENKNIETIYTERVPSNIKIGFDGYNSYIEGKDTILITWMWKYNYDNADTEWFLTSYNITKKKMLFQQLLNEFPKNTGLPGVPMIRDGKICISVGHGVYCLDVKTGEHKWRYQFPEHRMTQAIIGDDGRVYATSQGFPEGTLYCFDLDTGQELWTLKTDNSLQNMVYNKGYIYSVSSGSVRITAIDLNQRKIVWKYKCSETKPGGSIYYLPYISLDKSINRLFISSNTSLYSLKTL
jgi:outer membrane protein assembly factor BamB